MGDLFTIGYEGADIDSFLRTLRSNKIEIIFDVRELPLSRKAGFSKSSLSAALGKNGIDYVHLRALGDPKPGRVAASEGRFSDFRKIYKKHAELQPAQEALRFLWSQAKSSRACLLCFERDPENCHRTLIAERLSEANNFHRIDLYVDDYKSATARKQSPRTYSRQSLTAAE